LIEYSDTDRDSYNRLVGVNLIAITDIELSMREETITIELDNNSYRGSINAEELFDSSNQEWLKSVQTKPKRNQPSGVRDDVFQNALPPVSGIAIDIGIMLAQEVSAGVLAVYLAEKLNKVNISEVTLNGDKIRVTQENIKNKLVDIESIPSSDTKKDNETSSETRDIIIGQTKIEDFTDGE